MNKKVFVKIVLAASVLFNFVFIGMWLTHALPRHFIRHGQHDGKSCGRHGCAMQRSLALNDSQFAVFKPGIESFRETTAGLCLRNARNRALLLDELEKTPVDTLALTQCKRRIVECQSEIQEHLVSHILKEKTLLTKDQMHRYFAQLRKNAGCAGVSGLGEKTELRHDCEEK
jgi:hypothetical protein